MVGVGDGSRRHVDTISFVLISFHSNPRAREVGLVGLCRSIPVWVESARVRVGGALQRQANQSMVLSPIDTLPFHQPAIAPLHLEFCNDCVEARWTRSASSVSQLNVSGTTTTTTTPQRRRSSQLECLTATSSSSLTIFVFYIIQKGTTVYD